MAYVALELPPNTPVEVMRLVRDQFEPHLHDVHTMLHLPVAGQEGMDGGCNFAAALSLLAVLSGVSVTLFQPSALTENKQSAAAFKNCIMVHYPWRVEPARALRQSLMAQALWGYYRNPLSHSAGVLRRDPGERVIVRKDPMTEDAIVELERAATRPSSLGPTLESEGGKLRLRIDGLNWGVRQTVVSAALSHAGKWSTTPANRALSFTSSPWNVSASSVAQAVVPPLPKRQ